jgi:hypothetical protein
MVWAHFKLETNNREDIVPYLQGSTVNEYPEEELLSNHKPEKDEPSIRVEVLSNSIFEEYENAETNV